jgi:hypothetical protein
MIRWTFFVIKPALRFVPPGRFLHGLKAVAPAARFHVTTSRWIAARARWPGSLELDSNSPRTRASSSVFANRQTTRPSAASGHDARASASAAATLSGLPAIATQWASVPGYADSTAPRRAQRWRHHKNEPVYGSHSPT